jgi:formylglycine-generating enzyme required for sulfatase activity
MHGNVWEWCDDVKNPGDPRLPRIHRGGAWNNVSGYCRAGGIAAAFTDQSKKHTNLGLRVARVPVDKDGK